MTKKFASDRTLRYILRVSRGTQTIDLYACSFSSHELIAYVQKQRSCIRVGREIEDQIKTRLERLCLSVVMVIKTE